MTNYHPASPKSSIHLLTQNSNQETEIKEKWARASLVERQNLINKCWRTFRSIVIYIRTNINHILLTGCIDRYIIPKDRQKNNRNVILSFSGTCMYSFKNLVNPDYSYFTSLWDAFLTGTSLNVKLNPLFFATTGSVFTDYAPDSSASSIILFCFGEKVGV